MTPRIPHNLSRSAQASKCFGSAWTGKARPIETTQIFWIIKCVAKVDKLVIKDITANRGNCLCPPGYFEPQPLRFADAFSVLCFHKEDRTLCTAEVLELQ